MGTPVQLDLSKAKPITLDMGQATAIGQPVKLDLSKAQPIAAQPEQPGFGTRLAQSVGIPTSSEEFKQSLPAYAGNALMPGAGNVTQGLVGAGQSVSDYITEIGEAGENIGRGQPVLPNVGKVGHAASDLLASFVPGGETVKNVAGDVASKNYAGAAGGTTGILGQLLALKGSGKAAKVGTKDLPTIRSENLDVALSVGGRPKGVDVHAEVAAPIAEHYARKAQELGQKPSDYAGFGQKYLPFVQGAGRKIYQKAHTLAKAVKDEFSQTWNEKVLKPVENFPARKVGESAVKEFREKLASDQEFLKEMTNTRTEPLMKKIEAYILENSKTIGSVDAFRKKLNAFSADYFSKDEQGQLRTAFGKKAAAAADRAIRNNEYKAIEEAYGPEAAGKLRAFQELHGAAIESFNMIEDAIPQLSGSVSREGATPPLKEQVGALGSSVTMANPLHAVGSTARAVLTPSQIRTFGANMAKVIDPRGVKAGPLESPVPSHAPTVPADMREILRAIGIKQKGQNFKSQ